MLGNVDEKRDVTLLVSQIRKIKMIRFKIDITFINREKDMARKWIFF